MNWQGQRVTFVGRGDREADAQACADEGAGRARAAHNAVIRHAFKLMRSEAAQMDATLLEDFQSVMEGEAIYLPSFFEAGRKDFQIMRGLLADLQSFGRESMVDWSKHLKFENPEFSPTFRKIVADLETYFDVEVLATRLNFYRDGTDWKPFHHDSHAYGSNGKKEDFTGCSSHGTPWGGEGARAVGASFGGSRELAFMHPGSGHQFTIPQHNGDIFAFTSEVNSRFQHGVPRAKTTDTGPRFSIIAWGRRKTINCRNGGPVNVPPPALSRDFAPASNELFEHMTTQAAASSQQSKEAAVSMAEVAELVEHFVAAQQTKEQKEQLVKEQRQNFRARGLRGNRAPPADASTPSAGGIAPPADARVDKAEPSPAASRYPVTRTGSHRPLVRTLKSALGDKYAQFREESVRYQHGELTPVDYYTYACEALSGRQDLLSSALGCMPDAEGRRAALEQYILTQ